jgi:hypothetical protein
MGTREKVEKTFQLSNPQTSNNSTTFQASNFTTSSLPKTFSFNLLKIKK